MAKCTTLISSTSFSPRPAHSTSWTAATLISNVSTSSPYVQPSSSCAQKRTFCWSGATHIRWIRDPAFRSDQTVILTAIESAKVYPDALRRVSFYDVETDKRLKFLTNNFMLPALTIAQINKRAWRGEV